MKNAHNQTKKLNLEKLQIAKLANMININGGKNQNHNNNYGEDESVPTWPTL